MATAAIQPSSLSVYSNARASQLSPPTSENADLRDAAAAPSPPRQVPDRFAPDVFDGSTPEPETWLAHFHRYVIYRRLSDEDQLALFPLFLKGLALDWFDNLREDTTADTRSLLAEFKAYFCPSELDHFLDPESLFSRVQQSHEKTRDYIACMQKLARHLPGVDEETLKCVVVRGLRPSLKAHVLQHQPTTLGQILEAARFAEAAGIASAGADGNEPSQIIQEVWTSHTKVQQLATSLDKMISSSFHSRSPTQSRRTSSRASLRQVTFADSPAGRNHQRSVTSSEPRGDRYIYRGRGRPPCQPRDTSTALLQERVQSSLDNGRGSAPHQPRHGDGTHYKLLPSSPW